MAAAQSTDAIASIRALKSERRWRTDSVLALYNYVTKKIKPKDPTDTGLDIVTPSNVDEFLKKAGG